MTQRSHRLASLIAHLVPGETAVRLLPAGEFRSADGSGRPTDAPAWRIDAAQAAILIARDTARSSRRVVDYEHQTLLAAKNGNPAPAAGWIGALEWREGDGLYAQIEWTEKAAAMIAAGEYRYLSPVFPYAADGRVLDIAMAGLTNNPGLDGLTDLAALSAVFANLPPDQEKEPMDKLLAALGLAITASEAEALAALAALTDAKAAALTAQPDPAKYAPAETVLALQGQIATLTAQIEAAEITDLIEVGLSDGRILPSLETWARSLNKAALKGFLDHAQPIAALTTTQTGGKPADQVDPNLPLEDRCAAQWKADAALRAEFSGVESFIAYTRATESGLAKIHSTQE